MRGWSTWFLIILLLPSCAEDQFVIARRLSSKADQAKKPAVGTDAAQASTFDAAAARDASGSARHRLDDASTASDASTGADAASALAAAYLFILLDQSGTMGDGVNGDRTLKWDPVTAALRMFFAAPPSSDLQASLTLFPPDIFQSKLPGAAGDEDTNDSVCEVSSYTSPQVAMIPLPEDVVFSNALEEVTPPNEKGTPTGPALSGTLAQAETLLAELPSAPASIVVITDGVPGNCDMLAEAELAAERARARVATYVVVIGEASEALDRLAAAGGTVQARMVPVGDPAATEAATLLALTRIQSEARLR